MIYFLCVFFCGVVTGAVGLFILTLCLTQDE